MRGTMLKTTGKLDKSIGPRVPRPVGDIVTDARGNRLQRYTDGSIRHAKESA